VSLLLPIAYLGLYFLSGEKDLFKSLLLTLSSALFFFHYSLIFILAILYLKIRKNIVFLGWSLANTYSVLWWFGLTYYLYLVVFSYADQVGLS